MQECSALFDMEASGLYAQMMKTLTLSEWRLKHSWSIRSLWQCILDIAINARSADDADINSNSWRSLHDPFAGTMQCCLIATVHLIQ